MSNMNSLKAIINTLSRKEIKFINDYYKNNELNKRLILFNLILKNKNTINDIKNNTEIESKIANNLYGKKSSAYSILKKRLKDDLFNLMIFFDDSHKLSSSVIRAEHTVQRKLYQAGILYSRRLNIEAKAILKDALAIVNEYDLVDKKTQITHFYSFFEINEIRVFNSINKQLIREVDLMKDYYKAFAISLNLQDKLNKKIKLTIELKEDIDALYYDLNSLKTRKESIKIMELYFRASINYFLIYKRYDKAFKYAKKMLVLVKNNKEVKSILRLINSYLQLFEAALNLKKYKEASKYAKKAYETISKTKLKDSRNELIVLKYVFLANFHDSKSKKLELHLNKGLSHPVCKKIPDLKEEWQFYKAMYHFKLKEFNEVKTALYSINKLIKGNSGWNFAFRLLEIMMYIDEKSFDMVEYRIETFRKFISKSGYKSKERIKLIHKILKTLDKTGYNFKETAKIEKKSLQLLSAGKDAYQWEALGFELIRFDSWFFYSI